MLDPGTPCSDVILGHGWANEGYTASDIDPSTRGVGWLIAEGGIPRHIKTAYLTDEQVADLAARAAKLRAEHGGSGLFDEPDAV